jgi:hypothetical protein
MLLTVTVSTPPPLNDYELVASAGLVGSRRNHPRVLRDTFRPHVVRVLSPTPPSTDTPLSTETRLFRLGCCAIRVARSTPVNTLLSWQPASTLDSRNPQERAYSGEAVTDACGCH